jgi:tetratricopeptide (TPR) repeat protein
VLFRSPAPPATPGASAAAAPDKERALALLGEGNSKLDQGLYVDALAAFEAAYAAFPSPRLHFNIAQTLHELGRPLEALRHYEQFLAGVPQDEMPAQWTLASERIFQLQGRISTLALQCSAAGAAVSIDGSPAGVTPLPEAVRLLPGRHLVLIDKAGHERRVIELDLTAGATHTERVELLTSEAALAQRQEFQRAEAARQTAELRLRQEQAAATRARERRRRNLRTGAWVALGVSGAALATAATTGALAWRENAKVEDAEPGTPWTGAIEDHYDRAALYRRVFYVSAAVSVVGLATGGGLLLYSRSSPAAAVERAALVPLVHAQAGGLAVLGSF